MKKVFKYLGIFIGLIIVAILIFASTQIDFSNPKDLNAYLEKKFKKANISGMAVTLIEDNNVSFFKGYGYADIDTKREITNDTIFQIASISKTVTGTAVMQLYERGKIDLDKDINSYLPVKVSNPNYPNSPITPRMLLAHSSTLIDNDDLYNSLYTIGSGGGDSPVSLEEFVSSYFVEGGKWYDKEKNFSNSVPGSYYEYSNCAYGLLGYLVETVSKQPFNEYCRDNIFVPLGMNDTGWFLSEIDTNRMAIPYEKEDGFKALPFYGFATYPDGCLKTSSNDYAKFIMAFINKGEYNGNRILNENTVNEMLRTQIPELSKSQAITWSLDAPGDLLINTRNQIVPGHTGGDPGILTVAFFLPDKKTGAICFINTGLKVDFKIPNLIMIITRLLEECS